MARIQTNASGTRSIEITHEHLATIDQYQLLRNLTDSNGYVDEQVLDKLRLGVRSLLETQSTSDNRLLDLCLDVVYHPNMKAPGLQNLLSLYLDWKKQQEDGIPAD